MISRGVGTAFRTQVLVSKENRNPAKLITNYSFLYVRHESIYFVAITKYNANAALVFETLHKIIEIFKAYFGGLDEETIRGHFVLAHELLDGTVFFFKFFM